MRRANAMRKPNRGTRRIFTVLWIGLALLVGLLGLRYRRSHLATPGTTPAEQRSHSEQGTHAPQPKPANVRNG